VTEHEFWALIEDAVGVSAEWSYDRLVDMLSSKPAGEIISFADRLAQALFALDREEMARRPLWDGTTATTWNPERSADGFLYARCAVVLAGHATYSQVLYDPRRFAREWDLGAEELLSVAPSAYEKATGQPWLHEEPVSYESGSNPDGWPHLATPSEAVRLGPPPGSLAAWWLVEVSTCIGDAELPEAIQNYSLRVEDEVVEDVSTALTHLLRASGGLPAEVPDGLQVVLQLSDRWDLRVRDPHPEYVRPTGVALGPAVLVDVNAYAQARWTAAEQDQAILGIVAYAVLAMLRLSANPSYPAIPELERLVAEARPLVPFP